MTDKELSVSVQKDQWNLGFLALHFTRRFDDHLTRTNTEHLSLAELRLTRDAIDEFLKGVDGDVRNEGQR